MTIASRTASFLIWTALSLKITFYIPVQLFLHLNSSWPELFSSFLQVVGKWPSLMTCILPFMQGAYCVFLYPYKRKMKVKDESKMDIILMIFLNFVHWIQTANCVHSTVITMLSRVLCLLPFYTQLFVTVCYQPRGNQGCGMVSSGGSAPSFYII